MKTQTIINIVFAVAFVGYVVSQPNPSPRRVERNPTFDTITCKGWNVVDADGKTRIAAVTGADGSAGVIWRDKDEKARIHALTGADESAGVQWLNKDEKMRIGAVTTANGIASVAWFDKDEKMRISAATFADGRVVLPTMDLEPPKKP